MSTFNLILERLPHPLGEVKLFGLGEPLMHPQIFEMVKAVKKKGSIAAFTTNGYLLDKKRVREIIDSGLDFIRFSIDTLSSLEKIFENIKDLVNSRGKAKKPVVTFNVVVSKNNVLEVPDIIKYGKKIGIDGVNLIAVVSKFTSEDVIPLTSSEAKEVFKYYLEVGKQLNFSVGGSGFYARKYKYCPRIIEYVYINQKADVTPCCWMPTYKIGNIFEKSLFEIWNSKELNTFRENWEKICGNCNLMK